MAVVSQSEIFHVMNDPGFYPHPVARIELRETHISKVFLTGDYAYKIKKAVDLLIAKNKTWRLGYPRPVPKAVVLFAFDILKPPGWVSIPLCKLYKSDLILIGLTEAAIEVKLLPALVLFLRG